jgi:hypothetical protein
VKNFGRFQGYKTLLGKTDESSKVPEWFRAAQYGKIEDYVRREARDFINAYIVLKREIPKIRLPVENT